MPVTGRCSYPRDGEALLATGPSLEVPGLALQGLRLAHTYHGHHTVAGAMAFCPRNLIMSAIIDSWPSGWALLPTATSTAAAATQVEALGLRRRTGIRMYPDIWSPSPSTGMSQFLEVSRREAYNIILLIGGSWKWNPGMGFALVP